MRDVGNAFELDGTLPLAELCELYRRGVRELTTAAPDGAWWEQCRDSMYERGDEFWIARTIWQEDGCTIQWAGRAGQMRKEAA